MVLNVIVRYCRGRWHWRCTRYKWVNRETYICSDYILRNLLRWLSIYRGLVHVLWWAGRIWWGRKLSGWWEWWSICFRFSRMLNWIRYWTWSAHICRLGWLLGPDLFLHLRLCRVMDSLLYQRGRYNRWTGSFQRLDWYNNRIWRRNSDWRLLYNCCRLWYRYRYCLLRWSYILVLWHLYVLWWHNRSLVWCLWRSYFTLWNLRTLDSWRQVSRRMSNSIVFDTLLLLKCRWSWDLWWLWSQFSLHFFYFSFKIVTLSKLYDVLILKLL